MIPNDVSPSCLVDPSVPAPRRLGGQHRTARMAGTFLSSRGRESDAINSAQINSAQRSTCGGSGAAIARCCGEHMASEMLWLLAALGRPTGLHRLGSHPQRRCATAAPRLALTGAAKGQAGPMPQNERLRRLLKMPAPLGAPQPPSPSASAPLERDVVALAEALLLACAFRAHWRDVPASITTHRAAMRAARWLRPLQRWRAQVPLASSTVAGPGGASSHGRCAGTEAGFWCSCRPPPAGLQRRRQRPARHRRG